MKHFDFLGVFLGIMVAIGVVSCGDAPTSQADDVEARLAFGLRVAGTYVGVGQAGNDPERSFADVLTFTIGGTYTGTSEDGDLSNGFNSPEHGAWERVGEREIAIASIVLHYDSEGAEEYVYRINGTGTFDADFNQLSAAFVNEVFTLDQDPLRDEPIAVQEGSVELERLRP